MSDWGWLLHPNQGEPTPDTKRHEARLKEQRKVKRRRLPPQKHVPIRCVECQKDTSEWYAMIDHAGPFCMGCMPKRKLK